ncbi:MAG: hypothetical protein QOG38_2932 [Hyphomicrobiales bacterium]|nr:hypothetical protein [Hyphomicrobiales bacterium]
MLKRAVLLAIAAIGASGTSVAADVISDWNEKTVALLTTTQLTPPQAERALAIVHLAMFEAVNAIEPRFQPVLAQVPAPRGASKDAAAAVAAGRVLTNLFPGDAGLKTSLDAYLGGIPSGDAKTAGIQVGEAASAQVLEARANDGSQAADTYRTKFEPGVYVPTPPTVGSTWPNLKPFVLTSASQFRPQPPLPLTGKEWAADYNELKMLGGRSSRQRSARQTEDARFWLAGGPVVYYPVVRQIAAAKKLDVVDGARFMALIAVARSDAFVAVFDAKYHYNFWRPLTAIRSGDLDNNPNTERDASWQPIDNTPMHPEYPCAHCIMSGTIASIVEQLFGSAEIPEVTLVSPTAPGATRRWSNIWALSDDVGDARIWAGFHYRFSTKVGQDMGRMIGQYAVKSIMRPANVSSAR